MDLFERFARKLGVVHHGKHDHRPHFYNCSLANRPVKVISVLQLSRIFTLEERRNGAVLLHFLITLYCFAALAVLCEHYFCASLEKLCKRLRIPTDVAGATFMAAGSSMPTMFIAIASVYMDEGDIGLGTIIGSTMFNILFITAVCGLCAGVVITLHSWPLIRDSLVYVAHLAGLLYVLHDNVIHFYEALLFPLMYSIYIIIMVYNTRLEKVFENTCGGCFNIHKGMEMVEMEDPSELIKGEVSKESNEQSKESFSKEKDHNELINDDESQGKGEQGRENIEEVSHPREFEPSSPFAVPKTFGKRALWVVMLPLHIVFFSTMPDCRKKEWETWYPLTFVISILWMALISYILVWSVSIIGETLRIPECIMGLTLLAAGSSVPDVISSLVVAKHGMGDMALANCVGSNIFDILCLGLPWFLATTVVHPHSVVLIQSGHMMFTALLLFGTVFVTLLVVHLNKWQLDKHLGCILMIIYFVFLTVAVLLEALPVGPGGHGGEAKLIPHHPVHVPHKGLGHRKHHHTGSTAHGSHNG